MDWVRLLKAVGISVPILALLVCMCFMKKYLICTIVVFCAVVTGIIAAVVMTIYEILE